MLQAANSEPQVSILHRDDDLLIVNKPSGLLVHRGWGRDRVVLVDVVRKCIGGGAVHPLGRLDRAASGVMVFGLTLDAVHALGGDGSGLRFEKTYLALVRGQAPASGTVDHAIPRHPQGERVPAITDFRRLCVVDAEPRTVSWVEAIPHHGRMHQVRRHLKHINHPIIGDANYGVGALNREIAERYGLRRLALHAVSVRLTHPVTDDEMVVHAPVPHDLIEPSKRLGFSDLGSIESIGFRV